VRAGFSRPAEAGPHTYGRERPPLDVMLAADEGAQILIRDSEARTCLQ